MEKVLIQEMDEIIMWVAKACIAVVWLHDAFYNSYSIKQLLDSCNAKYFKHQKNWLYFIKVMLILSVFLCGNFVGV